MQQSPTGQLLIQADFGRTALTRPAVVLANSYRLIVAGLAGGLIVCHIPLLGAPHLLIAASALYLAYVLARLLLPARLEDRFYTRRIQFWRAQIGIVCVTVLLTILGLNGNAGSLWLLYVPTLLLVSRYCERQRAYAGAAIEVAGAAVVVHLIELRHSALSGWEMAGAAGVRAFAVLLASFLVHYLARVDITAKQGASVRDRIIHTLLECVLLETNALALWIAIRDACGGAVNAYASDVYVYNHEQEQLRRIEKVARGYTCGPPIALTARHCAAQAARERAVLLVPNAGCELCIVAPILSQPEQAGSLLAVVVLHIRGASASEQRAARHFLTELLDHVWPICTYASIRQQFPLLDHIDDNDIHSLELDQVLDVTLETVCHALGFSFATISLADEDQQEIRTVRGKNVPEGWVAAACHPLNSRDIQADVLRTGQIEVISEWDPRFDPQIWATYGHESLVRVWIPLGHLGLLEAGFYKHERGDIPDLLIKLLERYARDVTLAIQNAQRYEREQRHVAVLARLHAVSYELQTEPQHQSETALLEHIGRAALDVLRASMVLLYPLNGRDGDFGAPIYVGHIAGRMPLAQPIEHTRIVRAIAESCKPYYQPDALADPQLASLEEGADAVDSPDFTNHHHILSFAGVPLQARGEALGVLCIYYRERRQFDPQNQQVIALFAQLAAAVVAGGKLIRAQERRRLEDDLHDRVKSSLRGLILLSNAASDVLETDPGHAKDYLHDLRRAAWGILADVTMILSDLAPSGYDGYSARQLIHDEMSRLLDRAESQLIIEMDEGLPTLPIPFARTLLYLLREAMLNAREHARARVIRVTVRCVNGGLELIVQDDGCGFVVDASIGSMHRGLTIMRRRVEELGGTVRIMSAPGRGTTVSIYLPIKEEAQHGA